MLLHVTLTLTPDLEGQSQSLAEAYALSECISSYYYYILKRKNIVLIEISHFSQQNFVKLNF